MRSPPSSCGQRTRSGRTSRFVVVQLVVVLVVQAGVASATLDVVRFVELVVVILVVALFVALVVTAVHLEWSHLVESVQQGVVVVLERLGDGAVGADDNWVVLPATARRSLQMALKGSHQGIQCGARISRHVSTVVPGGPRQHQQEAPFWRYGE